MTLGLSMTAMTRIVLWHSGHSKGSVCQACRIKSRHLREGNLVGAELFAFGAVFWWHGPAGVNVEAGMFQGLHAGNQFWGDEFVAEQFLENSIVKEFGQNAMRDLRCEMEGAVGIEQTVGDQSVNMRMKIEVFAISVEGENKGRNTFGEIEGELEGLGNGFLSEGRDAPEKTAVALKEGTKELG